MNSWNGTGTENCSTWTLRRHLMETRDEFAIRGLVGTAAVAVAENLQ